MATPANASFGPLEYGAFGEQYYPEPLHKFTGEVRSYAFVNTNKAITGQTTASTSTVTVPANASDGDIAMFNGVLGGNAAVQFIVNHAGYQPIGLLQHRVALSVAANSGASPVSVGVVGPLVN